VAPSMCLAGRAKPLARGTGHVACAIRATGAKQRR
jgi:hypothetical protein